MEKKKKCQNHIPLKKKNKKRKGDLFWHFAFLRFGLFGVLSLLRLLRKLA